MVLGVSISVSAEESATKNIVFLAENYTMPEDYIITTSAGKQISCGWTPLNSNDGKDTSYGTNNNGVSYWGDKGGLYPHFIHSKIGAYYANMPATSKFYVDTPGNYYIWSLTCNMTAITDGVGIDSPMGRHIRVGIGKFDADGKETVTWDARLFKNVEFPGFSWMKGKDTFALEEGWYTINVKVPFTAAGTNMIVLTTDENLVLDKTTTFAELEPYTDIKKPTFTGVLSTEYVDQTSLIVNLPDADDENLRAITYYVNGEKKNLDVGVQTLTDIMPLSKLSLKAEAMDAFGGTAVLETAVDISKITTADFNICDLGGNKIEDITDLASLSAVKATANVKSNTGEPVSLQIGIGVYDKNLEIMLDFEWADAIATTIGGNVSSANLALPAEVIASPSDYVVRAFIWEKATGDGAISSMPLTMETNLKEVE